MLLNYKYEIYPNEEQVQRLESWISICRQQYNSAILDKQNYYKKNGKGLSRNELQKQLTIDKKVNPFLREVPSQPLQEVLFRVEKAYDKFFKGEAKYPKLKKYKDYHSITFYPVWDGKQNQKKKKRVHKNVNLFVVLPLSVKVENYKSQG
ncbi:MAG: helix-turn-helix domain-containing protein [Bacillus sp. (in: Bacteria)]|nr:helix-turn-helix domain-containing protein [Bacillus sp. (in: firmicutes)]